MARIVPVPPSSRHPLPRWQVCYRDETGRQHSAGIYPSEPAARAVKRRIERGDIDADNPAMPLEAINQEKARTLLGDYITNIWWPSWRDQHPDSAYAYGKRIEKWILRRVESSPQGRPARPLVERLRRSALPRPRPYACDLPAACRSWPCPLGWGMPIPSSR
jgi:hypothetical protein